jgi:TRAP-type mannitol/chloroaromatic compound transport system substrate-binding protein
MHEPGGGLGFAMNEEWYSTLSDYEKAVIEVCCNEEMAAQVEEAAANNGQYLARLINEHGVEPRQFNEEVWDAFGDAAAEVFEETRGHSPLAAKINDAYQDALREIGSWRAVAEVEFSNQRNRVLGIV